MQISTASWLVMIIFIIAPFEDYFLNQSIHYLIYKMSENWEKHQAQQAED